MSTFSAVVRKPGPKITPKVAPRRNIQRHAPKPSNQGPALTPESVSESPRSRTLTQPPPESGILGESSVAATAGIDANSSLGTATANTFTTLTPPALDLDRTSPLPISHPRPSHDEAGQTLAEVRIPRNTTRGTTIEVPTVTTSGVSRYAGAKRKAHTVSADPPSARNAVEDDARPIAGVPQTQTTAAGARKRRKALQASPAPVLPRAVATTPRSSTESFVPFRRSTSSQIESDLQPPEALLQQATSQAAAVSELANSIESRTRSLRPRSMRGSTGAAEVELENIGKSGGSRRRKGTSKSTAIEQLAMDVVEQAIARENTKFHGSLKPDEAEEHEIDPAATMMGDLVKDSGLGKRSDIGNLLDEKWPEVKERWNHKIVANREAAKEKSKQRKLANVSGGVEEQLLPVADSMPMPQTTIVNGMIVLDPTSREVPFAAGLEQAVLQQEEGALEDEGIYRYVNSGRIGKKAGMRRGTKWDDDATDLFFKGLRMFGTDFMMISNMFPDMTRKQIKQKYVREERLNLPRVRENLEQQQHIGLAEFSQMTNMEFQDPRTIEIEIEAEEQRLREDDEKRRAQEGFIHDDADNVLPSTEVDVDEVEPDGRGTSVRAGETRAQAAARRVVEEATTLAVPKRRQRKAKDPSKARTTKKGRKPLEGVEERIGPIDQVGTTMRF